MKHLGLAALVAAFLLGGLFVLLGCQGPANAPVGAMSSGPALQELRVSVTTNAAGVGTGNAEMSVMGRLYALEWVRGTLTTGVDITVTLQSMPSAAGTSLWRVDDLDTSGLYYPRGTVVDTTNAALTYDGAYAVVESLLLVGKPRIVVGEGGATKTGTIILYYW